MANEKRDIRIVGLCGKAIGPSQLGKSEMPAALTAALQREQILGHELAHNFSGHPSGYVGYDSGDGKKGLLEGEIDPTRRYELIEFPDVHEPRGLVNLLAGPDDPAADALLKRISED